MLEEEKNLNKKNEKEKRIKKELNKLKKLYKKIPKEKIDKINNLMYRGAFLLVMAQDMEEELLNAGTYTTTTINSSQTFVKTHPLCKDYRDTIKSYQAVLKQLDDLTKDFEVAPEKKDELDEFIDS